MRKGPNTTSLRLILLIALWATLLAVTGCRQRQLPAPHVEIDEKLTFETIEAEEGYELAYSSNARAYYLIWTREDVHQIDHFISASALDQLNELDFSKVAALAVFHGRKGSGGYNVVIEHIGMREGALVVVTQFWENPPGAPSPAIVTSPYQLVKFAKDSRLSPTTPIEFHGYTQYHLIKVQ